jgi:hypothetical protein
VSLVRIVRTKMGCGIGAKSASVSINADITGKIEAL